ncbi:MAG TPA: DUF4340 domain-containing protein [Anaerolineae bacterium]|nr:DUF4340 domain-containing protein [Anaerolineae bacterium]
MTRLNQVLAGLLVVQLILAAVLFWPRAAGSSGEAGEPLFPGLEADQVVALTITGDEGQSIKLARAEGRWVLPEAGDYPVLEANVTTLLQGIAGLEAERRVTQTSGSHARLQVAGDEFNRRVEIELADGTRHVLYLGSSPSFGALHVRAEGQDDVFLTSDLTAENAGVGATDWVEPTYFSVPSADVVAMTLENANGTFQFTKEGEQWTMAGLEGEESLDATRFQTLLSRTTSVSLVAPLGTEELPEYGLDAPSAVVSIETAGDAPKTYVLTVGAQDEEDNSYVVKSSESPYYVRVSEFAVNELVTRARDAFLVATPTPVPGTPETAGTPGP